MSHLNERNWMILWSDNEREAHCRLLYGTEKDADGVVALMAAKYTDGHDFHAVEVPGFGSIADALGEAQDWAEQLASEEDDEGSTELYAVIRRVFEAHVAQLSEGLGTE